MRNKKKSKRIKVGHQHFLRGGGGPHRVKTRAAKRYLCRRSKSQRQRGNNNLV